MGPQEYNNYVRGFWIQFFFPVLAVDIILASINSCSVVRDKTSEGRVEQQNEHENIFWQTAVYINEAATFLNGL